MTRQYTTKKAGELKRSGNYIRQSQGAEDELRQLGLSFLDRPLHPIIASLDLEIYDGNRRHAGVLLVAGPDATVPVCLTGEPWSEAVKLEVQIESSLHSRGLTAFEQFKGFSQWLALNPGATARELAVKIHRDAGMVSKILALAKCIPAAQDAAAVGKLGVSDWYAISKVSDNEQQELLAMKLNGATRDALESQGRRKRNGSGQQGVRLTRVKIPLPGDGSLVLTGKQLGMAEVVEILVEVLKDARKAAEQFDVKTWQAMARDKAKAGG